MKIASRIFFCLSCTFFCYTLAVSGIKSTDADFLPFNENGKVGLKNNKGEVLIPAEYDKLGWSNGQFEVLNGVIGYSNHQQWGLLSLSNQKITKAEYVELNPGEGSLIIASKKIAKTVYVKSGCISTSGKVVVPFVYDGIRVSSLRAIVFEKSGVKFKHGLIDLSNRIIIPLSYKSIYTLGSLRYGVVNFDNKTAIFSEEGKQLTPFDIDSLSAFKKDFAIVYQNQFQGLIDRAGAIVLPPIYREIKFTEDGKVLTRKPDTWLFLQGENKMIRQFEADSITPLHENLYKIKQGKRWRLTNKDFKSINALAFSSLGNFDRGKALFTNDDKVGLLGKDGTVIIESKYEQLIQGDDYLLGAVKFSSGNRWMLLDTLGKVITPRQYEAIRPLSTKIFSVKNRGYWGAVDRTGKEIVACAHDSLIQFAHDRIVVKFKGQYGIITKDEQWLITPQPNRLKIITQDHYLEYAGSNTYLKNTNGNLIYFTSNVLEEKDNYLMEYLPNGEILKISLDGIITEKYRGTANVEKVFEEREGYRAIKKDGRFGFIDDRSRLRIANRYEDVKSFSEGLAAAKILGRWGFIDKSDRIAIQPVYDEVTSFVSGYALVKYKNLYGVIDKKGKAILPARFDYIEVIREKYFKVKQQGLYGLADLNGQVIINTKFDLLQEASNDFFIVTRDGKSGVITTQGLSTIPLIYDGIAYDKFHNEFLALKQSSWEAFERSPTRN